MVRSREISNRFLEDFRLTIGEMAADNNYSELLRLAHAEGLSMHSESAGPASASGGWIKDYGNK
ncbi:MAG: hypothetical protein KAS71_11450 [Bacteroidales bacterium]|nr:hypothetical protein [Bacteroidales bacterium]